MKLYKRMYDNAPLNDWYELPATLSDIKAYLSERGLVACPRSEAHYIFSIGSDGLLKQESNQLSPVDADSSARGLEHRHPEKTYVIMVLEP